MRYAIMIMLVCLLAALAACPKAAKDAANGTQASAPQAQPTGAATGGKDAPAAMPEQPPAGELPKDWPPELPPCAGSEVTSSYSVDTPDGKALSLHLEVQASMPDIVYYYFERAQGAGMQLDNCALGPNEATATFSGPQQTLMLTANKGEKGPSVVNLELKSGVPPLPMPHNVLWHDVDALPPQFPADVLVRYPQAKLKFSGINPDHSFVMEQEASATLAAVTAFYTKQFAALGFKAGATMENSSEHVLTFDSGQQQITLSSTLTGKLVKISLMLRSTIPPANPGQIK